MINLEDILPGDEVMITDRDGHQLEGAVVQDHAYKWVVAFGFRIVFARRIGQHWRHADGMKVRRHQPSLFGAQG